MIGVRLTRTRTGGGDTSTNLLLLILLSGDVSIGVGRLELLLLLALILRRGVCTWSELRHRLTGIVSTPLRLLEIGLLLLLLLVGELLLLVVGGESLLLRLLSLSHNVILESRRELGEGGLVVSSCSEPDGANDGDGESHLLRLRHDRLDEDVEERLRESRRIDLRDGGLGSRRRELLLDWWLVFDLLLLLLLSWRSHSSRQSIRFAIHLVLLPLQIRILILALIAVPVVIGRRDAPSRRAGGGTGLRIDGDVGEVVANVEEGGFRFVGLGAVVGGGGNARGGVGVDGTGDEGVNGGGRIGIVVELSTDAQLLPGLIHRVGSIESRGGGEGRFGSAVEERVRTKVLLTLSVSVLGVRGEESSIRFVVILLWCGGGVVLVRSRGGEVGEDSFV